MTTQAMYNKGLRCRSRGFCFLCKDTNGCVEYVNTDVKEKPPLGITPKYIWDKQRINDLRDAINRYCLNGYEVPFEWIDEYNYLINLYNKE